MSRALTIGNFDGVHLGHQRILERLKQLSKKPTVFTFSNHPSEILRETSKPLLSTIEHKIALLKKFGVETIIEPFTEEFSKQTPEEFLSKLDFSHLVLGHDAAFGHKREGQKEELQRLSRKMGFSLEYIEPVHYQDRAISSSYIRSVIEKGDFLTASHLLSRPYSIQGRVIRGAGRGFLYPTANIDVSTLCLPPLGVYSVRLNDQMGIANLGVAPTFGERQKLLEVHLLDFDGNLYDQMVEIVFLRFIRVERKFASKEALAIQIKEDIECLYQ